MTHSLGQGFLRGAHGLLEPTSVQLPLHMHSSEPALLDRQPAQRGSEIDRPERRLLKNIGALAGSQVVTWSLTLAWSVIVPRTIGPRGMGEITIAQASTSILGVAVGLGMTTLITKEVALDRSRASWLAGTAMLVRMALVVPAVGVLAVYAELGRFGTEQRMILGFYAGVMLLQSLAGPLQAAFQGIERMGYLALSDMVSKAGLTILGIVLVLSGMGVLSLAVLACVVAGVVLVLSLLWTRQHYPLNFNLQVKRVRHLVVGSLPYWVSSVLYFVYVWIDSVILSLLAPAAVVGSYGVASTLFGTTLFVPVILSTAWLPRLVAEFSSDREQFIAQSRRLMEIVMILSLPVTAGTLLITSAVVPWVYGAKFANAIGPLLILGISAPATYLNVVAWQAMVASNRQAVWIKVMAATTTFNPFLNLLLIPFFQYRFANGAIGAAAALLVTEVAMAAMALVLLREVLVRQTFLRIGRGLVATGGMAILVYMASPLGIAAQVAIGVAAFAILAVAISALSLEELRELIRLARGRMS